MTDTIGFVASEIPAAQEALALLAKRYGSVAPEAADVIVALGGDGFMLTTQHRFLSSGKPIYGMNKGTVGFLMNEYSEDDLPQRLAAASRSLIRPLDMEAEDMAGEVHRAKAINEVSLLRQSYQAAKLRNFHRRPHAPRPADLRRCAGRDTGRIDGV